MYTTVVELADRYRFSRDAIYAWVRTNLIPAHCVVRIGNSIRIDSGEFDRLMRDGKLYRPRGRQAEERAQRSREAASGLGLSEDQHTIRGQGPRCEHRFCSEDGTVLDRHPYSEEMVSLTRS